VRWLGWQDRPGAYFQLADWVICPSRYETLGNVILEAWSYHKPVLAAAAQGPAELIIDGDNGLLTPCNDPARLAARLHEALDLPQNESSRLAAAGHTKLVAQFSQAAIVRQYADLYELAPSLAREVSR
jgi:L-malate glycosyltransferase